MRKQNKLHLLVLLVLAVFLVLGCNLGKLLNKDSTTTTSSSPTPVRTPSTADNIKVFYGKAQELCDFTATDKLNSKAKIKGKVAIVQISSSDFCSAEGFTAEQTDYDRVKLEAYGMTNEDLAIKTEDIDTLVKSKCTQGKQIGQYRLTDGRTIPAYQLDCEVSIIDYKEAKVVAKKKFVSKELDDDIEVTSSTTEKNAFYPRKEIEEYVKSMVSK